MNLNDEFFEIYEDSEIKECNLIKGMNELPAEMVWLIFIFLPLKDCFNLIMSCQIFYKMTLNDNIWKEKFFCYFPEAVISEKQRKRFWFNRLRDFTPLLDKFLFSFRNVRKELKSDAEFVLESIRVDPISIRFASTSILNDEKIILEALKRDLSGKVMENVGWSLRYNLVFIKKAIHVAKKPILGSLCRPFRNNKEIVMESIKAHGKSFKFASFLLRSDKNMVLFAVRHRGYNLQFIEEGLRDDKTIILEAIKENPDSLKYASDRLKNNRDVVLLAVSIKGTSLGYASKELKNDFEVVMCAVKQNGNALEFCSISMKNNREIVYEAVNNDGLSCMYVGEDLLYDRDIIIKAIKRCGHVILNKSFFIERLKFIDDREIALASVQENGFSLKFYSEEIKNDFEIVLEAVKRNEIAIRFASKELKNNPEIALAAIEQNGHALKYTSLEIRNNKEIVLKAVQQNGYALQFAGEKLKQDKEVVLDAVRSCGYALEYANSFRSEKDVVIEAIKKNNGAIIYASFELQNDMEVRKYLEK